MVIRAKDIKDQFSFEQWLTEWPASQTMSALQSRQVALQIAHRVALRDLPISWATFVDRDEPNIDWTVSLIFRYWAISAGCSICPLSEIEHFATAAGAVSQLANSVGAYPAYPTAASASYVAHAYGYAAAAAATVTASVGSLNYCSVATSWQEVRSDALSLEMDKALSWIELWSNPIPNKLAALENEFFNTASTRESAFGNFWKRFYELGKYGKVPPWELLLEIAQIRDEEWEAGPARIAELIARIELDWLRKEVSSLKSELSETRQIHATALHRSHNQPPELVEVDVKAAKAVTLVWQVLDEAEEELEQEAPDPSKLKELSLKLWAALKIIAAYCGKKADKALDKSVEVVGETGTKWAIRVTAGSIAAKQLPLERIAQGLADAAKNLGF